MSNPNLYPERVPTPHASLEAYPHFTGDYAEALRTHEAFLARTPMSKEAPEGLAEVYDHVHRTLFSKNLCMAILLARRDLPIRLVDNTADNPYPHLANKISICTDTSLYERGNAWRYLCPPRTPSPVENVMDGIATGLLRLPVDSDLLLGRDSSIALGPGSQERIKELIAFYKRARMTGSLSLAFHCGGPEHTPLDTMGAYEGEHAAGHRPFNVEEILGMASRIIGERDDPNAWQRPLIIDPSRHIPDHGTAPPPRPDRTIKKDRYGR